MLIVALTGGIGSGKSLAGKYFAELGALVVDSDELARSAIERGTEGFDEVIFTFGDEVLTDGLIDRAKLAAVVFAEPEKRLTLEKIIHPKVREAFENLVANSPAGSVIVNQIPLLVETDGASRFQYVITVNASEEVRRERLFAKGFSNHEITKRIAAQVSDLERENIADAVLTNDRDKDSLLRQVENLYETVLLPKARANSI
jgi:dephospho-CoA kinase